MKKLLFILTFTLNCLGAESEIPPVPKIVGMNLQDQRPFRALVASNGIKRFASAAQSYQKKHYGSCIKDAVLGAASFFTTIYYPAKGNPNCYYYIFNESMRFGITAVCIASTIDTCLNDISSDCIKNKKVSIGISNAEKTGRIGICGLPIVKLIFNTFN